MSFPSALAQVLLYLTLSISVPQAVAQNSTPSPVVPRRHLDQNELCCFDIHFVKPSYPIAARLARVEGVVKLTLVIAPDNTIADLQPVSGNALLMDSAMRAVRRWQFLHMFGGTVNGNPMPEIEVPLEFIFKIEKAPKPAYLYLTNGDVVRADEVREFTDGIEYTVNGRTHHLSPDTVDEISACGFGIRIPRNPKEAACVPSGGPPVLIRAIPLLTRRSTESSK
jgi:TonB family protein